MKRVFKPMEAGAGPSRGGWLCAAAALAVCGAWLPRPAAGGRPAPRGRGRAKNPIELPEPVRSAPANTWVKLASAKAAGRESPIFFYAPGIGRFVQAAGGLRYKKPVFYRRYDTEHLDLSSLKWLNAYGEGLARGRPASGPISPDGWQLKQTKRGALLHEDGQALRIANRWTFFQWACAGEGKLWVYVGGQMATYDPASRHWAPVECEPHAGGARWASLCLDPVNKEIVQVGGHGPPFGTWLFDVAGRRWRKLDCGSPALRGAHAAAEALRRESIALLGRCANRFTVAETDKEAKVDLRARAADLAERLAKAAADVRSAAAADHEKAAIRYGAALLASAAGQYRKLAGGWPERIDAGLLGALRAARVQVGRAAHALAPEPTPRGLSQAAYDPVHKQIIVFGGDAHDRVLSDTWVYDCATRTWRQRFPNPSPPPRAGHALRWLDGAKAIVLAGGYSRRALASDLWCCDAAANRWRLLRRFDDKAPAPQADRMGYPLVADAAPGDVLVALQPRGESVWACRVDASKTDADGAAALGVAPGTFTFHAIDPGDWETAARPDAERTAKFLADLPANRWTAFPPAGKYAPGARNRWGTTAYDRDRHQFLFWGGGHATSMEDDVAHFSIRGGCWTISYPPDCPLNRGSYMSWGGVTFQHRPAMPNWHAYQAYEYDPSGRMFYLDRAYDVASRQWEPAAYEGLRHGSFARSMVEWTPHGVVCYSRHGLYRFDAKAGRWAKQPWDGPALKKVFCDSTAMCYDSSRDCLWLSDDGIVRYGFADGKARRVEVRPPEFMNVYGQCGLLRECVHIPEADLVLIWRLWKAPDGRRKQVAWDPKTRRYLWVDLPWWADGKAAAAPKLSWHAGIAYDPALKRVFLNDSHSRRVWALRFDRASAKLAAIGAKD